MLKSVKPPALEEVQKLTVTDIAIMAGLADSFRDSLKRYIQIDPFTMPDPFTDKDDYNYFVIADKRQMNRIVSLIAINKDLSQIPWDNILGIHLIILPISKQNAVELRIPITFIRLDIQAKLLDILCSHFRFVDYINDSIDYINSNLFCHSFMIYDETYVIISLRLLH
jgi:hypothetical protein